MVKQKCSIFRYNQFGWSLRQHLIVVIVISHKAIGPQEVILCLKVQRIRFIR